MNREEIVRLAHEAECLDDQHYGSLWADRLIRFASLVAAAERERAATVCEDLAMEYRRDHDPQSENIADECYGLIRALP